MWQIVVGSRCATALSPTLACIVVAPYLRPHLVGQGYGFGKKCFSARPDYSVRVSFSQHRAFSKKILARAAWELYPSSSSNPARLAGVRRLRRPLRRCHGRSREVQNQRCCITAASGQCDVPDQTAPQTGGVYRVKRDMLKHSAFVMCFASFLQGNPASAFELALDCTVASCNKPRATMCIPSGSACLSSGVYRNCRQRRVCRHTTTTTWSSVQHMLDYRICRLTRLQ